MYEVLLAPEIAEHEPLRVDASPTVEQANQERVRVGVAYPEIVKPLSLAVIVLPIENAPLNVGVPVAEAICKTVVGPKAADAGALPLPFRAVTLK